MGSDELPTRTEIRKARKADLQTWAREAGLDDQGLVADLRARLVAYLEEEEAAGADEEEAPEEFEKEAEEKEEELEIFEEAVYAAKAKPELPEATRALLAMRARHRARLPRFRRQEWFRYKRVGVAWRRPRGHHSKLRRRMGYRPPLASAGYRGPQGVRGLHPSGFEEVAVYRPEDLDGIDPKTQAARIAHSVGTRKRLLIQDRADELGVRVLNRVVE